MTAPTNTTSSGYLAAHEGLAFYRIPNPGFLRFSGETRADYLQRQTTNDLGLLSASHVAPSLLTSATGRILEVFILLQDSDAIGMLTQPGHGPGLTEYFKKRVFFNDQVKVEDLSDRFAQIELHGPQAPVALKAFGLRRTPELNEIAVTELENEHLRVIGEQGFANPSSFKLLFADATGDRLDNRLIDLGAVPLGFATRELLRIEAGRAGDPEFTDAYTPFEVGLDKYVSVEKGCYTGQEVLARQVTYDKIVRNLARIRSQQPSSHGDKISVDGKQVGTVTSAAISPELGAVALTVLRKPFDAPGTVLEIQSGKSKIAAFVG